MSDVARGNTAGRDGTRLPRLRDFALQVDDEKTQKAVLAPFSCVCTFRPPKQVGKAAGSGLGNCARTIVARKRQERKRHWRLAFF